MIPCVWKLYSPSQVHQGDIAHSGHGCVLQHTVENCTFGLVLAVRQSAVVGCIRHGWQGQAMFMSCQIKSVMSLKAHSHMGVSQGV